MLWFPRQQQHLSTGANSTPRSLSLFFGGGLFRSPTQRYGRLNRVSGFSRRIINSGLNKHSKPYNLKGRPCKCLIFLIPDSLLTNIFRHCFFFHLQLHLESEPAEQQEKKQTKTKTTSPEKNAEVWRTHRHADIWTQRATIYKITMHLYI